MIEISFASVWFNKQDLQKIMIHNSEAEQIRNPSAIKSKILLFY